jgi:hypothetical protein
MHGNRLTSCMAGALGRGAVAVRPMDQDGASYTPVPSRGLPAHHFAALINRTLRFKRICRTAASEERVPLVGLL